MNSSHKSAAILVHFIGIREVNLPVILNSMSVLRGGGEKQAALSFMAVVSFIA
jgi:hypothetical protein